MKFRQACTALARSWLHHHFGIEPDMVVLAKALSGGLIPVGRDADDQRNLPRRIYLTQAVHCPHFYFQRKWVGDAALA